MKLVRYNPRADMVAFRDQMDRFFDGFFTPFKFGMSAVKLRDWNPLVDINENEGTYVIKAELPGVDKENIELDVKDRVLTLKGERKSDAEEKGDDHYRKERFYGKYRRAFSLPSTVDADRIEAEYKDGVLTITIPKSETEKPKQISIH